MENKNEKGIEIEGRFESLFARQGVSRYEAEILGSLYFEVIETLEPQNDRQLALSVCQLNCLKSLFRTFE